MPTDTVWGSEWTYAPDVDALYMYVADPVFHEPVAQTVELSDSVHVDKDAEGNVIGIELLAPPAVFKQMFGEPDAD